jgi:ubiquinol-cytochrome c reductase cytochrome b subunit
LLHDSGRTRLIYSHTGVGKIPFYPFYWVKDGLNVVAYLFYVVAMLIYPYSLGEVELFEEVNTLVSPVHIVPEWYFCSQYAMLRSVPSKGAGVVIIAMRVLVFLLHPLVVGYDTPASNVSKPVVVLLVCVQLVLTYLGFAPIEQPFVWLSLIFTFMNFIVHIALILINLGATYSFAVGADSQQ